MVRMLACCALAALFSTPALACGVMEKSDPKVGSIVKSVSSVSLTFSEAIVPASSGVTITDETGHMVSTGKPVASGHDTALSLTVPALAPGKYKVHWEALWLDCHSKTTGNYKFTVQAP